MSNKHYDYFVIGAGSGGVRSARIAAQHGARVGVAEGSALGGTCVNLGCIPKKLMAYAADYSHAFEDARGYGWGVPHNGESEIDFDWGKLIANKNTEIERLNGIYEGLFDKAGVDLIRGYAAFVDERTVEVEGQRITADNFLIAVGGRPRVHPCEGGELLATSDDAFFWPKMPREVVIIGGGYIAVEFAHILSGLGAKVTIVHRGDMILRGFDDFIRHGLVGEMRKQGIKFHFNCDVERVEKDDDIYALTLDNGVKLTCDLPLSAIGRVPNLDRLALDEAGVETKAKSGLIQVNDQYQTNIGHIYAIGDVTETMQLTPVAIQEGHVLADRLYGGDAARRVNYDHIATAVFSQPPIATVGMITEEAIEAGYTIQSYSSDFRPMKYTLAGRDERSLMRLIVCEKSDKVLGVHMMGLDAPEIMQGFAVALNCGARKADFDKTMAMHPTSAEEFVLMRTKDK